ncbi:hypothetical protein BJX61DRAFT_542241 [Aspergillus egyptiacus]|nr:hypothetical protein BJX61DRAFT_542241 [Aspergillus egyptiacus]
MNNCVGLPILKYDTPKLSRLILVKRPLTPTPSSSSTATPAASSTWPSPDPRNLYPTVRFVFASARRSNGRLFHREATTRWFDVYYHPDGVIPKLINETGLADCNAYLETLVRDEAELLRDGGKGKRKKKAKGEESPSSPEDDESGYDRIIVGGHGAGGVVALCH